MLIRKAFKYRIYPTDEQQAELAKQFGCSRYVYNLYLNLYNTIYEQHGHTLNYVVCANDLADVKRSGQVDWLNEADSQVLQQTLKDLHRAFQNFFEKVKKGTLPPPGKKPRKDGKPKGYPRFHRKHDTQSIRYPQRFKLVGGRIYLPKVGWVEIVRHRKLEGMAKNVTVLKSKTGKYFVSIQCEVEVVQQERKTDSVGIDLGLKHFAILSTGEKIDNPKHLRKSQRRVKIRQRRLSRKCKGSNSRAKQRKRVATIHEKVRNQRRDFHHKVSRKIVNQYGSIGLEDLAVKNLVKNHHLAQSISDVGWSQFVQFITYKTEWMGGEVIKHDRFFASSKTCSECSSVNQSLTLSDREWVCASCGTTHDRDINAAINLKLRVERPKYTPVEIRAMPVRNSAPEKSQHRHREQISISAVEAQCFSIG